MAVLMLHYCSGLADCLENFDSDKEEEEELMSSDTDEEEEQSRPLRGDRVETTSNNHNDQRKAVQVEGETLENRLVDDDSTRRNDCQQVGVEEGEEGEGGDPSR